MPIPLLRMSRAWTEDSSSSSLTTDAYLDPAVDHWRRDNETGSHSFSPSCDLLSRFHSDHSYSDSSSGQEDSSPSFRLYDPVSDYTYYSQFLKTTRNALDSPAPSSSSGSFFDQDYDDDLSFYRADVKQDTCQPQLAPESILGKAAATGITEHYESEDLFNMDNVRTVVSELEKMLETMIQQPAPQYAPQLAGTYSAAPPQQCAGVAPYYSSGEVPGCSGVQTRMMARCRTQAYGNAPHGSRRPATVEPHYRGVNVERNVIYRKTYS